MTEANNPGPKPPAKKPVSATSTHRPIRIALVEDQAKARENWTKRINSFPDFNCICSCISAEEALTIIPDMHPDVDRKSTRLNSSH